MEVIHLLDLEIISLYFKRSEEAILQTQKKYGGYCLKIARNILPVLEDAQECVNDTYLAAWESIPPHKPLKLSTYLGKLTRRISIDRWRHMNAQKRGGDTVTLALEELGECIASDSDPQAQVEAKELGRIISRFLLDLPGAERRVFVGRYFRLSSVEDIASEFDMTQGNVYTMLSRTRSKLRQYMIEEGY